MSHFPAGHIRLHLKRGVQELPRTTLLDILGSAERHERGLDLAADVLAARLEGLAPVEPWDSHA